MSKISSKVSSKASSKVPTKTPSAKQAKFARSWCERFMAERARLQRVYCDMFKFWRDCRDKRCRRHRRCCGDAGLCLNARIGAVPAREQFLARQQVLRTAPQNASGAERTVQQFMPRELPMPDAVKAAEDKRRHDALARRAAIGPPARVLARP